MKTLKINVRAIYSDKDVILLDGLPVETGFLYPTQKIYDKIMERSDIQDLIEIGFIEEIEDPKNEQKDPVETPPPANPPIKNPIK